MSVGSVTSQQDALDSQYLLNSISGLSKSRSTNSTIVRAYKQATQLYLTKRFRESLETLEPIISPINPDDADVAFKDQRLPSINGPAPVAQSSKGTRTKVWVFYLSLLHAIIELGLEEGKAVFGSAKWRQLAAKARDGSIWEEIVQRGYGGNECDVDAEVVQNLSTLLLGHMQDQRLNQQRLETWLSMANDGIPYVSFDGADTPLPSGATTPKVLNTRLKVLELYALHILPANGEWELSQGFIEANHTLDDERREAFQQALENLREEREGAALREKALREQREREMMAKRRHEEEEDARRIQEAREARQEAEKRRVADAERIKASQASSSLKNSREIPKSTNGSSGGPSSASKGAKKALIDPPPTLYRRASIVIGNLQRLIMQARLNLTGNNTALLQSLMFIAAFLLLISRQDLRLKLKRTLNTGWHKVKQTVGMGVKVSYM